MLFKHGTPATGQLQAAPRLTRRSAENFVRNHDLERHARDTWMVTRMGSSCVNMGSPASLTQRYTLPKSARLRAHEAAAAMHVRKGYEAHIYCPGASYVAQRLLCNTRTPVRRTDSSAEARGKAQQDHIMKHAAKFGMVETPG